jgi:hypothetical protein
VATVLHRVVAPLRGWEAQLALRAERRRADEELLATRSASPRLAWRIEELVADGYRTELGRRLADAVRAADQRLPGRAWPLNRSALRVCRAQLLALASRLCDLERPVAPRGVLLVERLLSDRSGPLRGHRDVGRLRQDLAAARSTLEREPVSR